MNQPLLSISIPTYNRASFITELLDSIVVQFDDPEVASQIEITISDNASTDNTAEVVKKYSDKYQNIKYFRMEKNMGFDRNFVNVVTKSSGKYCLSIGDDDAFFSGSLAKILFELKNSTIPFYGLNNWGYDQSLKHQVLPYPSLCIKKDIEYERLSDYVKSIKKYTNIVGLFVGLSTQLFIREPWVKFEGKEEFYDTLAVHMYVLLSIYKDSPYKIIAEPYIKTRSSNIRWDTFAGLGSIQGRITSTIQTVTWIKKLFSLPMPVWRINLYFYTREYWFTSKEIMKKNLQKIGLGKVIDLYRRMR